MPHIHPDLERIAERLTSADLRSLEDDDVDFLAVDHPSFVDVYSPSGLKKAFREYGIDSDLAARDLGDHRLLITRDDAFRHRLEIVLPDEQRVMDLRLHLKETTLAGEKPMAVIVVDWLSMQNPRLEFSDRRAQLPGQKHPGTGMGRKVNDLLQLMCRRLGRDALVTVPERFHLAVLYRRLGYVGVDDHLESKSSGPVDGGVSAALAAGLRGGLSLAGLAWAVERGFVRDARGEVYVHQPTTLLCAVSPRMARAMRRTGSSSRSSSKGGTPSVGTGAWVVDVEGLKASLVADPVPGLASPTAAVAGP